jgi:hypothetical protein
MPISHSSELADTVEVQMNRRTSTERGGTSGHPPPEMPPVPPGDSDGNEGYEMEGRPFRCVYIHSPQPNTQYFNHNACAKNTKCDEDVISDLLSTLFVG